MGRFELTERADGAKVIDLGGITRMVIPAGGPVAPELSSGDAFPKVVLDQREMYRLKAEDAKTVRAHWENYLANQRPPVKMTLARDRVETQPETVSVVPYVNHSRWVADCSHCGGGMACWDQNPYACCLSCGWEYEVNWQPPALRAEGIRMLAVRAPEHRNWDLHKVDVKTGEPAPETVEDLIRQNILMLGVGVVERNGLMVSAGVEVPQELADQAAVLEAIDAGAGPGLSATEARTFLARR